MESAAALADAADIDETPTAMDEEEESEEESDTAAAPDLDRSVVHCGSLVAASSADMPHLEDTQLVGQEAQEALQKETMVTATPPPICNTCYVFFDIESGQAWRSLTDDDTLREPDRDWMGEWVVPPNPQDHDAMIARWPDGFEFAIEEVSVRQFNMMSTNKKRRRIVQFADKLVTKVHEAISPVDLTADTQLAFDAGAPEDETIAAVATSDSDALTAHVVRGSDSVSQTGRLPSHCIHENDPSSACFIIYF